jgi:hypothetical protein
MPQPPREDDAEDLPPRPRRRPAESDDHGEAVEPVERARRPRPRRDEEFEEDDRPRRRRDEEEEEEDDYRPRKRRREEEDDEDERPRRRRRRRKEAIESLIPYHNPKSLAAYYCGVFSLIPVLGLILGPIALILGIQGIRLAKQDDSAGGMGHSITGLILGSLTALANWGLAILVVIGLLSMPRIR